MQLSYGHYRGFGGETYLDLVHLCLQGKILQGEKKNQLPETGTVRS